MEIRPFKAYRYDSAVVGDCGKCIAPPYDVIDGNQQDALYNSSPYNIARIIKGKTEDGDNGTANQYSRAGEYLADWVAKGVVKPDENEAIYAYVQNFSIAGASYQRSGFVALGKLADFGEGVQPHEKTLDGPKADRLNLMRATGAQFGQIFMMFNDPEKIADAIIDKSITDEAAIDFTDDEDVRHRLYPITGQTDVDAIVKMMGDKEALIADGHHRYETALNYFKETANPAAEYRMMTFVNMHNEGLVVLPTHRLVGNLEKFDIDELIKKMQECFKITKFEFSEAANKAKAKSLMDKRLAKAFEAGENAFGIYDGKDFYFALFIDKKPLEKIQASDALKGLDVVVLHDVILDAMLGIGAAQLASQSNLKYIKDIGDAVDKAMATVDSGEKQCLFFMNSTPVEQVRAVSAENEKMPQKSTFFYPKIFTGLTINKL